METILVMTIIRTNPFMNSIIKSNLFVFIWIASIKKIKLSLISFMGNWSWGLCLCYLCATQECNNIRSWCPQVNKRAFLLWTCCVTASQNIFNEQPGKKPFSERKSTFAFRGLIYEAFLGLSKHLRVTSSFLASCVIFTKHS